MTGRQSTKSWERSLEEAGLQVEAEVRRVIAYLNDEIVPEIRRDGSNALRYAAGELTKLAQRMEERPAAASSAGTHR